MSTLSAAAASSTEYMLPAEGLWTNFIMCVTSHTHFRVAGRMWEKFRNKEGHFVYSYSSGPWHKALDFTLVDICWTKWIM